MRDKVRKHEGYIHPPKREGYVVGTKPGRLVAAAVLRDGTVWTGERHADIIMVMARAKCKLPIRGDEQGFWTEDGWFLMRDAALTHAVRIGQIVFEKLINKHKLTSEDLW